MCVGWILHGQVELWITKQGHLTKNTGLLSLAQVVVAKNTLWINHSGNVNDLRWVLSWRTKLQITCVRARVYVKKKAANESIHTIHVCFVWYKDVFNTHKIFLNFLHLLLVAFQTAVVHASALNRYLSNLQVHLLELETSIKFSVNNQTTSHTILIQNN